jgi:hypothetical protein
MVLSIFCSFHRLVDVLVCGTLLRNGPVYFEMGLGAPSDKKNLLAKLALKNKECAARI